MPVFRIDAVDAKTGEAKKLKWEGPDEQAAARFAKDYGYTATRISLADQQPVPSTAFVETRSPASSPPRRATTAMHDYPAIRMLSVLCWIAGCLSFVGAALALVAMFNVADPGLPVVAAFSLALSGLFSIAVAELLRLLVRIEFNTRK